MPLPCPAPRSTRTRCLASASARAPAGASATRCSPVLISRGTPTIMCRPSSASCALPGAASRAAARSPAPGPGPEALERPAVDHLRGLDPGAPGCCHAEPHVLEIVEIVRVRVDGDEDAELGRAPSVHVVQVQPLGIAVD